MKRRGMARGAAGIGAAALAIGALAGCTSGGGGGGEATGDEVVITWWHNATSDPLQGLWEEVAAEFEDANPGVRVEVTGYQNEELQRTLIPNALQSGDAPDVFMVWPGGEVRSQAEAGHLRDLTQDSATAIEELGSSVGPWEVDGAVYALLETRGGGPSRIVRIAPK